MRFSVEIFLREPYFFGLFPGEPRKTIFFGNYSLEKGLPVEISAIKRIHLGPLKKKLMETRFPVRMF
jgi:hypothetical protein